VPQLADCCFVHLTDSDASSVRYFSCAHRNAARAERFDQVSYAPGAPLPSPLIEVLRNGKPEIMPMVPEGWLQSFACRRETFQILREETLTSALLVPLLAHDRALGVITFFLTDP